MGDGAVRCFVAWLVMSARDGALDVTSRLKNCGRQQRDEGRQGLGSVVSRSAGMVSLGVVEWPPLPGSSLCGADESARRVSESGVWGAKRSSPVAPAYTPWQDGERGTEQDARWPGASARIADVSQPGASGGSRSGAARSKQQSGRTREPGRPAERAGAFASNFGQELPFGGFGFGAQGDPGEFNPAPRPIAVRSVVSPDRLLRPQNEAQQLWALRLSRRAAEETRFAQIRAVTAQELRRPALPETGCASTLQWDDSLTMASYAPLEVRAMAKSAREYRQRMRELEARELGRQDLVAGPDLNLKVLRSQRHEASRIRLLRVAEHAAEEAAQVFFQRTSELQPSVVVPSSGDAVLSAATSEPQPLVEPSEPPRAGYVWTRSSSFGSGIQWIEIPMTPQTSADV